MIDDLFINDFKSFKTEFENRIKNNNITYYDNDCYLIDNGWYIELEKKIEIYKKNKVQLSNKKAIFNNSNMGKLRVPFPQQSPIFMNDINDTIKYLKCNNMPQLISIKLMNKIYKKENLKNMKVVKYYSGFNNLIIMFMEKEYNKGIFLFNPLNKYNKNNIFFFFTIKNKENNAEMYSELLQMKNNINNTLLENLVEKRIIIHYQIINGNQEISYETEEYINNNSNENILKIFISIFYFEKSLSLDIKRLFLEPQKFNLINPDWLIEFKNNYNYEILYDL